MSPFPSADEEMGCSAVTRYITDAALGSVEDLFWGRLSDLAQLEDAKAPSQAPGPSDHRNSKTFGLLVVLDGREVNIGLVVPPVE